MIKRYDIYEFTGKKLRGLVDDIEDNENKMMKQASKFAKKHKANPDVFLIPGGSGDQSIMGFNFDKAPDRSLWKKVPRASGAWLPKNNTLESKKIHKQYREITTASTKDLQKAVGWKTLLDHKSHRVYFFSMFRIQMKDGRWYSGMKVPVFTGGEDENYMAAKGMKLVTHEAHEAKWNKIEKEQNAKSKRKRKSKKTSSV